MGEGRIRRRLAAILAADVVGYSRLVEADEAGTIARLKSILAEVIQPRVAEDGGRVVKLMGDGALVEFASAVDAVSSALAIQAAMARFNEALPEASRIAFRIGINVGDVIVDGDDVQGDGVNIAARLEGLCDAGAVFVSGSVHDQVAGKLDADFDDLGEHTVKNIAKPVRVYRARAAGGQRPVLAGARAATRPSDKPSSDRPSIAVLPFQNMSGDEEQDYFSDGITEDIITALGRIRQFFVIARNSTFTFKGRAVDVHAVARDLGVRYVLEGSVRKAGNRVRITAQLIDGVTGRHVWAERYDRDLDDVFALQDEITRMIVASLLKHIETAHLALVSAKPPSDMAAYDYLLKAKDHHHRVTKEDNDKALELINQALAVDPAYSEAYAWRACTLGQALVRGFRPLNVEQLNQLSAELDDAIGRDEDNSECHRLLSGVSLVQRNFEKAVLHNNKALALNPNDPRIVSQKGELLTWLGRPEEGLPWLELAMRLDPYHGDGRWEHLGLALFVARRYSEAIEAYRQMSSPSARNHATLAACYTYGGNEAKAGVEIEATLVADPDFKVDRYLGMTFYQQVEDKAHHRDGMLKAGLPA